MGMLVLQMFHVNNCPQVNNKKLLNKFLLIIPSNVTLGVAMYIRFGMELVCKDDRCLTIIAFL